MKEGRALNESYRLRSERFIASMSWCTRLRVEVVSRFRGMPSGTYSMGDFIVNKRDTGALFVWARVGSREVLVAWGSAWRSGGYSWRCLNSGLAKEALQAIANAGVLGGAGER